MSHVIGAEPFNGQNGRLYVQFTPSDPTRPDSTKLFCRVATVGRCELGTLRHVLRVDAVCCDLAYKSGRN